MNPKEYFEVFKNKAINKKHKGVEKSTPGMNFESFASRIMDIKEYSLCEKQTKTVKQKFASLNDKRYYLTDGITSLPYILPYVLHHYLMDISY